MTSQVVYNEYASALDLTASMGNVRLNEVIKYSGRKERSFAHRTSDIQLINFFKNCDTKLLKISVSYSVHTICSVEIRSNRLYEHRRLFLSGFIHFSKIFFHAAKDKLQYVLNHSLVKHPSVHLF